MAFFCLLHRGKCGKGEQVQDNGMPNLPSMFFLHCEGQECLVKIYNTNYTGFKVLQYQRSKSKMSLLTSVGRKMLKEIDSGCIIWKSIVSVYLQIHWACVYLNIHFNWQFCCIPRHSVNNAQTVICQMKNTCLIKKYFLADTREDFQNPCLWYFAFSLQ